MKSELDTAWTMVMSWTPVNRRLSAFFKIPFKYNSPQNEDALNWDLYRLSLARMRFLQTHSTHWRATCSYPTHGIDFKDYLRGNFKDFNIFDFVGERQCKKVEDVNIRGHVGTDLTALFWQKLNTWTLHIDSTHTHCEFKTAKSGAASSEDNFGWYGDGLRETSPLPSGGLELTFNLLRAQQSFSGPKNCNKVPCSVLEVLNKNVFAH